MKTPLINICKYAFELLNHYWIGLFEAKIKFYLNSFFSN